jgi:hypothetical protein
VLPHWKVRIRTYFRGVGNCRCRFCFLLFLLFFALFLLSLAFFCLLDRLFGRSSGRSSIASFSDLLCTS